MFEKHLIDYPDGYSAPTTKLEQLTNQS